MKKIILSNWRFKLISLLVGFVIWILLVNISNPEVVRTKTVPLTVLNESVLTRAGKTYTLPNSDSVTVSYQVRTRDAYKIQAEDFRATVDLENLYDITGAVPVMVEVVGNRDLIGGMPTARPGVIRVDTENVQNKVFSLDTHEEGEPASGYEVGAVTLSSRSVRVSGPESEVGRISSVGVRIPVSDATESFSGTAPVIYYDANGNEISLSDERLTVDPKEVEYEVSMLRGKSLTLSFQTSGEPAAGFNMTGIESAVRAIPVTSADTTLLNKTTELSIPASALNIEGAREDKVFQIDVANYLPSGITATGNTAVTVTVKITPTTDLHTGAEQRHFSSRREVPVPLFHDPRDGFGLGSGPRNRSLKYEHGFSRRLCRSRFSRRRRASHSAACDTPEGGHGNLRSGSDDYRELR